AGTLHGGESDQRLNSNKDSIAQFQVFGFRLQAPDFRPEARSLQPEAYFPISTSAILFTPLSASARLPSFVTLTLRTTPPPDGIFQVWNFSVFGSKRTSVFGSTPDSLYQITPLITAMP